MTLAPYRDVLALPRVRGTMLLGVLARIPITAAAVVLTLHVVVGLGRGYGAAGLVGAVATAGAAVGAPWRGRAIDRLGLRRALLPSVLAEAVVWGVAPFLGYRALLVAVGVGGVLSLPVFNVVRQCLSVLVPADQQRTGYALDAIGTELSFMVGPALGVLVATQVSSRAALVAVGGGLVVSGLALMVLDPPTTSREPAAAGAAEPGSTGPAAPDTADGTSAVRGGSRRAIFTLPVVAVLGAAVAGTFVLSGTEVGIVAVLRDHGALDLTSLVYLAWGIGSIAGGAVYGGAARAVSPFTLLLGLSLLTMPVGLAPGPLWLALGMLPAAALCAPVISATAEAVGRLTPEHVRGEAMGWYGAALTTGVALGAPAAGAAIDLAGTWAGFVAVGGLGLVLVPLGLLGARNSRGQAGGEQVSVADGAPAPAGS